jgi:hypothetical protein
MSKRGPLSKIEKFYIEQNLEFGTNQLSLDLDRAKSVVKAYAKKCEPLIAKEKTVLSEQIVSNERGSTIMTENGSVLGDEFKSSRKNQKKKRPDCVAQIYTERD